MTTKLTNSLIISIALLLQGIGGKGGIGGIGGFSGGAGGSSCTLPFTDSFSGSGTLGSCWSSTISPQFGTTVVQSSGKAVPLVSGDGAIAVLTGATVPAAQSSQYSVGAFFPPSQGGGSGPVVRWTSGGTFYTWNIQNLQININIANAYSSTLTSSCPSVTTFDVVKLSITSGFVLTCTDVTAGTSFSVTDTGSTIPTGTVGFIVDQSVSTNAQADSFQGTSP